MTPRSLIEIMRQHGAFVLATLGSFCILLFVAPIEQDPAYHAFADHRTVFGIPNFFDVASSAPLFLVGLAGLWACLPYRSTAKDLAWLMFFAGITLVGPGSAYYHWLPRDETLVWDRLPMALASAGLFVALVSQWVSTRLGATLLVPAVLTGLASVVYWRYFGDLRLYVWIQLLPVLTLPLVILSYRARDRREIYLAAALVLYVLARISEIYDKEIFALSQNIMSGHTFKHLLAALAIGVIAIMLKTEGVDRDAMQ